MEPSSTSVPRLFWLLLAALGLVLTMTVVPGVFTVDEDNYLVNVVALRQGRVTVPGTEGLTPSSELVWFDPAGAGRRVTETPVASTAPPLYAPLALPFSWLGWRGLVFVNVLGYLAATLLVFVYARRYATRPATPWLAAAAFAVGGYAIEYAQGVWPQMLSLALTTAAAYLAARVRDGGALGWAAAAGLLVGLATGVRYQNFFFAACLGLGIFLWTKRRFRAGFAYAAGLALPLLVSGAWNLARLGFFNPVTKGAGYLPSTQAPKRVSFVADFFTMAWARIVDYSARPPLAGTEHAKYLVADPATGAYVIGSAVKKAWLQSAPWLAVALLALVVAWLLGRRWPAAAQRRELLALSLVVVPTLAMFSASGVTRTDGYGFNQRYFLELVPLAAIAFAWALDRVGASWRRLLRGVPAGAALGVLALLPPPTAAPRQLALLYLPLVLSLAVGAAWLLALGSRRAAAAAVLAGACLGWAATVHLGDDLVSSRGLRRVNAELVAPLPDLVPDGSAILAFWGYKDALGPLLLERDVVVLDVRNDQGFTARTLSEELLARGRRVFILADGFPSRGLEALTTGRQSRSVTAGPVTLVEIREGSAAAAGPAKLSAQ